MGTDDRQQVVTLQELAACSVTVRVSIHVHILHNEHISHTNRHHILAQRQNVPLVKHTVQLSMVWCVSIELMSTQCAGDQGCIPIELLSTQCGVDQRCIAIELLSTQCGVDQGCIPTELLSTKCGVDQGCIPIELLSTYFSTNHKREVAGVWLQVKTPQICKTTTFFFSFNSAGQFHQCRSVPSVQVSSTSAGQFHQCRSVSPVQVSFTSACSFTSAG